MKRRMFVAAGGATAGAALAPAAAGAAQSGAYVGNWAARPAANSARVGTEITVTDIPRGSMSRWFSDGKNWRPINGSAVLYAQGRGYTSPLGSVSWAGAAVTIAIPGGGVRIPAGTIAPGMTELRVSVLWATGANSGGVGAQMTIGTTNSWNDPQCIGAYLGPNNEWDQVASFTFPTDRSMSQASSLSAKNGAPAGALGTEYSANIDVASDMYVNFGTTNGGVNGNVLKIVRVMVELFL